MYYKNLSGRRYGKWVVLDSYESVTDSKARHTKVLCRCDCGNVKMVDSYSLTHGDTFSCGKCNTITDEGDYKRCTMLNGTSFIFDPEDEEIVRRYTWSISRGYPRTMINNMSVYLQRVLLPDVNGEIDHINGDKTDYRRENLRIATHAQNNQNKGLRRDSTTGYKGVCFDKRSKRYIAYINANNKRTYLGYFMDKEDAARAYDKAAVSLHGDFARLNFT